ncbi:MAG: glycosyltransferase family 39 protein [Candidatus Margulisbacteria bacterium]|nr:glycosyltransferase family 39 protein [Candidatus Margulisiibacteriota bacterium]
MLSLILRLAYNNYLGWDRRLIGDEQRYYELAKSVAEGKGYIEHGHVSTQMPGASLILALFFVFLGASPVIGKVVVSLASATMAPLIFIFAMRFQKQVFPALLTGLWIAIYPYFLHETTMMDSENFFIPLIIIFFFYFFDLKIKKIKSSQVIWGGILWGVLSLIRPNAYYLTIFLIIWLFVFQDKPGQYWQKKLKITAIFLITFSFVLSPWIIHNHIHFKKFIPTNTDAMEILLASHNEVTFTDPVVAGNYLGLYEVIGSEKYDRMSEQQRKIYFLNIMKKYWLKIPWLVTQKLKWFWHYSPKHPYHRNLKDDLIGLFSYGIFVPFFIWGFWQNRRDKKYQLLLWIILYFNLVTIATYGCTRLRLPLDPLLIMVAFITITELLRNKLKINPKVKV